MPTLNIISIVPPENCTCPNNVPLLTESFSASQSNILLLLQSPLRLLPYTECILQLSYPIPYPVSFARTTSRLPYLSPSDKFPARRSGSGLILPPTSSNNRALGGRLHNVETPDTHCATSPRRQIRQDTYCNNFVQGARRKMTTLRII